MRRKEIIRNIGFVLLGMLIWNLIDLIWDWKGNAEDFNKGRNSSKEFFRQE